MVIALIITVHKTIEKLIRYFYSICCYQLTAFMLFPADLFYKDLVLLVYMYVFNKENTEQKAVVLKLYPMLHIFNSDLPV